MCAVTRGNPSPTVPYGAHHYGGHARPRPVPRKTGGGWFGWGGGGSSSAVATGDRDGDGDGDRGDEQETDLQRQLGSEFDSVGADGGGVYVLPSDEQVLPLFVIDLSATARH